MGSYELPQKKIGPIGFAIFKIIGYQQIQTDKQSIYIFRLVNRYRTSGIEMGTFGIFSFPLFSKLSFIFYLICSFSHQMTIQKKIICLIKSFVQ